MRTIMLFVALLLGFIGGGAAQGSAADDKNALLAFKGGGDPDGDLASWSGTTEPCADPGWNSHTIGWSGVQCDVVGGRVTRLYLNSKDGLLGTVDSLVPLTALTYLSLQSCVSVSGDVSSLVPLTRLTGLHLSSTSVSGSVEPLAALTQLRSLRLYSTSVSGSVSLWQPSRS